MQFSRWPVLCVVVLVASAGMFPTVAGARYRPGNLGRQSQGSTDSLMSKMRQRFPRMYHKRRVLGAALVVTGVVVEGLVLVAKSQGFEGGIAAFGMIAGIAAGGASLLTGLAMGLEQRPPTSMVKHMLKTNKPPLTSDEREVAEAIVADSLWRFKD